MNPHWERFAQSVVNGVDEYAIFQAKTIIYTKSSPVPTLMSERQEHAVFFKELPPETVPYVQIKLADGTSISLASNSELPLEKLNPDQDLYLAMFPYLEDHVFVKTTAKEFIETETQLREMEDFETNLWPQVTEGFAESSEKFPAIFEAVQNGVEGAEELWQHFMEDCMLIALGHKILEKTDVMVLLEYPEADPNAQKEFPVFRIKA
jgi:hypothetical protein